MTTPDSLRSCVLGLATGDALSWVASDHREYLLPERRLTVLRILDTYADQYGSTTRPRPHVHSSPVSTLRPGPSDDVEWFVVTARALASGDDADVAPAWKGLLPEREDIRARVGTLMALDNLGRGLEPPQSGHDNAHYFDDIACVRAVAAGLLAGGDDATAVRLAEADASVTHSLDGVWCARAMAVLVSRLGEGDAAADAVRAAVAQLPEGSWSHRLAEAAVHTAGEATSALDLAMRLDSEIVDKIYSYAIAAPETMALLLAHTLRSGSAEELMLGAFGHGRNADALPALAGAVAGLRWGHDWVPTQISDQPVVLDGVCVPSLAGVVLEDVIDTMLQAQPAHA